MYDKKQPDFQAIFGKLTLNICQKGIFQNGIPAFNCLK
jgi:hypothetical protein